MLSESEMKTMELTESEDENSTAGDFYSSVGEESIFMLSYQFPAYFPKPSYI